MIVIVRAWVCEKLLMAFESGAVEFPTCKGCKDYLDYMERDFSFSAS